jgi:hypothetical protein
MFDSNSHTDLDPAKVTTMAEVRMSIDDLDRQIVTLLGISLPSLCASVELLTDWAFGRREDAVHRGCRPYQAHPRHCSRRMAHQRRPYKGYRDGRQGPFSSSSSSFSLLSLFTRSYFSRFSHFSHPPLLFFSLLRGR